MHPRVDDFDLLFFVAQFAIRMCVTCGGALCFLSLLCAGFVFFGAVTRKDATSIRTISAAAVSSLCPNIPSKAVEDLLPRCVYQNLLLPSRIGLIPNALAVILGLGGVSPPFPNKYNSSQTVFRIHVSVPYLHRLVASSYIVVLLLYLYILYY